MRIPKNIITLRIRKRKMKKIREGKGNRYHEGDGGEWVGNQSGDDDSEGKKVD